MVQTLQPTLRSGSWQVTVAVHGGKQIIGVWPGLHELAYGLAVDVGSTTIAAHLCDLGSGEVVASAGVMNPQIRFGEDLMSRVSYSMMNPGGAAQMTEAVRAALNQLAADVTREAKVQLTDILEVTLVGNPIMHHLLLGIDPVEVEEYEQGKKRISCRLLLEAAKPNKEPCIWNLTHETRILLRATEQFGASSREGAVAAMLAAITALLCESSVVKTATNHRR